MTDDFDDEQEDRVTCALCGVGFLHWQETIKADGTPGHLLFNERGRKHECFGLAPTSEGFINEEQA